MKATTIKMAFKIFVLTLILGITVACNQSSKYTEDVSLSGVDISEEYKSVDESSLEVQKLEVTNTIPKDLKIIKTGNSRYKVKNVIKATSDIKIMALKYDAYVSDLRFENDQYKKEIRFTIKIPAMYFDKMMDSVHLVSEFTDYENVTTTDVTEEYLDLQTRLKTKIEVKGRYEDILRKNAKTVEDILATEDKLRVIQEEIESAQGRLNYLTNKVAYSTIQIDLYETVEFRNEPTIYKKSFWSKTKEGLSFGWNFMASMVLGIIYIWPLVILAILVFLFVRNRMRAKK